MAHELVPLQNADLALACSKVTYSVISWPTLVIWLKKKAKMKGKNNQLMDINLFDTSE